METCLERRRRHAFARLVVIVFALLACSALAPTLASASSVGKTALLDSESVTTGDGIILGEDLPISLEQYAAEQAGFTVTVKTGEEWEKMTAEEFGQYQVLIIGDPSCSSTAVSAVNSAAVWTPVVMGTSGVNPLVGNRTVVGTDPEFHYANGGGGAQPTEPGNPSSAGAEHLVQDGIAFAGGVPGATGVYFDTSCEDLEEEGEEESDIRTAAKRQAKPAEEIAQPILEGPDGRDKTDVLEHLTAVPSANSWTENISPPCGGSVQQVAANSAFDEGPTKLLDSDIQGWGCSDHITFPTFPPDWFALAVATDTPSHPTCGTDPETSKEVCGEAYVLLAGVGIVAEAPNLSLTPKTETTEAGPTHTHTVTANVHKEEKPLAGVKVTFSLTGQNAGVTGTCTTGNGAADPECLTDEEGSVRFTYADTNGAGTDTIIAGTTLESAVEEEPTAEAVHPAATTPVLTTERATATQVWSPVVTSPAPPAAPPAAPVAKSAVLAFGTAHLASSGTACVASSGYTASVKGDDIASVTYTLDGRKLKTLKKANSHGIFSLRVAVTAGKKHNLTVHVVFTSATSNRSLTIHKTLARCAAVHHVSTPRFTG